MTQNPVEQSAEKKKNWLITSPDDENFLDCLIKACYGNERAARILNYFLVLAAYEVENKHLEKGCKVVTLSVKHDSILKKLKFNISEKTLIRYLDLLNQWNYVNSERYQRDFAVNVETIQKAMNTPPEPPKKKVYNRHPQKGCSSTTLQPLSENEQNEVLSLHKNVVELQEKVVMLQLKVVELQQNVDKLQLYNFQSASVAKRAEGHNFELPYIYYNNTLLDNKIDMIVASLRADDAPSSFSEEDVQLGITPETLQSALQDFTQHKIETSSEQLEKVLVTVQAGKPDNQASTNLPIVTTPTKEEVTQSTEQGKASSEDVAPVTQAKASKTVLALAEQIVLYTEEHRIVDKKVGGAFTTRLVGGSKKSQRDRQVEAAVRILKKEVTIEQYIKVYTKVNKWWSGLTGKSLTVEKMADNTKNKVMRVLEELEEMGEQPGEGANKIINFPEQQQQSQPAQKAVGYRHVSAVATADQMRNEPLW